MSRVIDTLNRLDIDEQQRDLSDIRTRRLDFRLKKLNAAKSRTHRILTMASDMLVRGLKHIEKLPGYEHLQHSRNLSMKAIRAPAQSFEIWVSSDAGPDRQQAMAEFTMHCVYEMFSLVEDMIAAVAQVAYLINNCQGKPPITPDKTLSAQRENQLRQQLQATFVTALECLECMADTTTQMDTFSATWDLRMNIVPLEILETFDSHNNDEKTATVEAYWLAAFAERDQANHDISAFLRRANLTRALFCRPWIERLMVIKEDVMAVVKDLEDIRRCPGQEYATTQNFIP